MTQIPGTVFVTRGSFRSGPRLRGGGSASSAARGLACAPLEPLCGTGGLSNEKGLAQLGGWNGHVEGLAWSLPPWRGCHRCPHSLPLTFALGSLAIETATRSSAAPKAPAARRGRGRRWGGVEAGPEVGRGLGRRDQEAGATGWGGRKGTVLISRPLLYTIETFKAKDPT